MNDWRNIRTGSEIPREDYCDQPYAVPTEDGAWLCVMTTARGHEGAASQHVVATRSTDWGKTWSPLIDIEPPGPPEASYATLLKVPGGRVYAFYNHNTDNLREVLADTEYGRHRVDTLGHFVFKYSDDGGLTWSAQRTEIPVRATQIDRENPYGGQVRFFWHVGRPLIHRGAAYVTLHKVGRFGEGFMARSEGWFLRSDNILTERDPAQIRWQTLPDGEVGLRAPDGPIAEEHSLVALSDGSLYCTYRTTQGHPCHAYSRDGGHTWTAPEYMTYSPGGRRVKHPRAANFVWRAGNGKYLYWFHNHGGHDYPGRNPAWLCGGLERDGFIHWSQPEIVLYDDDPQVRISYPDLVEQNGRTFITETQKTIARVHEIDATLLDALWSQHKADTLTEAGLALNLDAAACRQTEHPMPRLPDLSAGGGFALEVWLRRDDLAAGQVILDSRRDDGAGIVLATTEDAIQITLHDGQRESSWDCDAGLLQAGRWHHVVAIVDGGPKIVAFVVNGVLCDGGTQRQYGWGRFDRALSDVSGAAHLRLAAGLRALRVYARPLLVAEAVANYRFGVGAAP